MNNRQHDITSISHTAETIAELREDHDFAVEYLKAALEELDHPDHRAAGLLALRDVAEAYGGIAAGAAGAGISRVAPYPGRSPPGNPPPQTPVAVLHAVGMRLSVVPAGAALKV